MIGLHDRARASGPAASPRGTSTASTSPPAAPRTPAGCCALPATELRRLSRAVVPVRAALHRRPGQHGAPDRVHRPPARGARGPGHAVRRPRARAEQPGIRRDPRGRRAAGHLRAACCRRWRQLAGARHHRRAVHGARRAAPPGQRRRARARRAGAGRPRGRALGLAGRPRRRPRLGDRPGAGGRRRGRRVVRASSPRPCPRTRSPPATGVGLGLAVDRVARAGGQGGHRPGLRRSSRPCGPTRRWTAPRCRAPTSSRASTARW